MEMMTMSATSTDLFDVSVENGISFWSVADNLRAGSAKLCFDVLLKYFIKRS